MIPSHSRTLLVRPCDLQRAGTHATFDRRNHEACRAMAKVLEKPGLYERDLVLWAEEQARLLRAGRLERLDCANLALELDAMARSRHRELRSRLRVLIAHLLKCDHQPSRRTRSWVPTILAQRQEIADLLAESPSLVPTLEVAASEAYPGAVQQAALDTGLDPQAFPDELPYGIEHILGREPRARGG